MSCHTRAGSEFSARREQAPELTGSYIFLSLYPKSASGIKDWSDRRMLVPFFRRLCIAVDGLHKLHISHEDLKRSNVLVTHKLEPILADFGFSHLSPGGKYVKSLGGTAEYSSPEKTKVSWSL